MVITRVATPRHAIERAGGAAITVGRVGGNAAAARQATTHPFWQDDHQGVVLGEIKGDLEETMAPGWVPGELQAAIDGRASGGHAGSSSDHMLGVVSASALRESLASGSMNSQRSAASSDLGVDIRL